MFDREQFKKEIEAQLQDVPRDKRVAFAVRSAMRVLPLLALQKKTTGINAVFTQQSSDAFWFWKTENKNDSLLAVLSAYSCSIKYLSDVIDVIDVSASAYTYTSPAYRAYTTTASAAYTAYVDATVAADTADTDTAAYTSASAASAAGSTSATTATSSTAYAASAAASAAAASVSVSVSANIITQEIQQDLAIIEKLTTKALLQQPLWSQTIPKNWQQLLADFKADVLSLNAGFEVWLDWYDDRLHGKPIDVELLKKWNTIPKELKQQGAAAVNAYLKNLVNATKPLNRVRAIFIGYGEAGKTSLIRTLHDEPVVEGKEGMTAGIAIRDWSVPDTDIKAHFWDFGGQVMAHATHQFFLRSSCLYVLVLNARSEINSTEQAEYWLEHVKGFGKDAPVMIVGNKADQATINLDMSYLKGKYPNIVDFYPISCTQAETHFKAKFDSFKLDFCQQLRQVGTHQMLFTKEQFGVLEALRHYSPQEAFLPCQKFIKLCTEHGIGTEGVQNRDWLLDILDKLGMVIHFPHMPYLDDYVLNPRWLTHGVYTLMYKQQAKLTAHEVVAILRDKPISDENGNKLEYQPEKCAFITKAMQEFKLCYPLPHDHNTLIIPELLPTDQPPNIPFEKQGALAFEFVFRGFLPRHVMPELIVNRHEEIVNQIVWQRGVLLQHKIHQALALLQVDYHERVLFIWVQGRDAKDYLSLLNDEVLKILGRLELDYKEWIALPLSACMSDKMLIRAEEKAPYRQILAFARKSEPVYISESGLEYDLNKVLGIIMPDSKIRNIHVTGPYIEGDVKDGGNVAGRDLTIGNENMTTINQNVTNSTIHGSVVAAEKIENSFNNLQESKADDAVKILLEQLLTEIKALNAKVPASQAQQLADMAEETETLIGETGRETPRKKWYEASLGGIKDAALAIGEIAKPVLAVAEKLSPLLLSL